MKRNVILSLMFLLCWLASLSQEQKTDPEFIVLRVEAGGGSDKLDKKYQLRIENRCKRLTGKLGFLTANQRHDLALFVDFQISQTDTIYGIQAMIVLKAEVILTMRNEWSGTEFGAAYLTVSGSGHNQDRAIGNAIDNLTLNKQEVKDFFEAGKSNISDYYNENCQAIIREGELEIAQENYLVGFRKLYNIPEFADQCSEEKMRVLEKGYEAYINKMCGSILIRARGLASLNKFEEAMNLLVYINPNSSCYSDASELVGEVESEARKKDTREWKHKMTLYKDDMDLKKENNARFASIMTEVVKNNATVMESDDLVRMLETFQGP